MLNHGVKRISVPTGNGGFAGAFPKVEDDVKFYTFEELEEMAAAKEAPVSTWPGKKEDSEESANPST